MRVIFTILNHIASAVAVGPTYESDRASRAVALGVELLRAEVALTVVRGILGGPLVATSTIAQVERVSAHD